MLTHASLWRDHAFHIFSPLALSQQNLFSSSFLVKSSEVLHRHIIRLLLHQNLPNFPIPIGNFLQQSTVHSGQIQGPHKNLQKNLVNHELDVKMLKNINKPKNFQKTLYL